MARRQGVNIRNVDYAKVSAGEVWRLAEEQLEATQVPGNVCEEYFRQLNQYIETIK